MSDMQPMTPAALAAIRERRRRASDSSDWPVGRDNYGHKVRTRNGDETVYKVQLGQNDLEFCTNAAADVDALLAEVDRLRGEAKRAAVSALVADAQEQGGY